KRARRRSPERGPRMKALTIGAALGAALLLTSSGAFAAPSALAKACAKDVKSVCGDVKAGGGKLAACMKEHFSDLSSRHHIHPDARRQLAARTFSNTAVRR